MYFEDQSFKDSVGTEQMMCCSAMIAWGVRPVRCLSWVDHAECQPDFCISDAMCCRLL